MKKVAILGASYLQVPLIKKAKSLGIETHVFAWEQGAIGKDLADFFYPISILERDRILEQCTKIKIDGITTIGTDIAMPTVNYIAKQLDLVGNTIESTLISTDKFEMRKALSQANIPCPKFAFYDSNCFENIHELDFPVIVKPTDRSGSRGVTKAYNNEEVRIALKKALENSINKRAIVEEFINSEREFSVEFISYNGIHYPLAITDKVTTREPYFVELEHHQPAAISEKVREKIFKVTQKVLDALGILNGASHTELYLLDNGDIRVVESAGRMGGELIGSHMVELSTGFDFLHATLDVALGDFEYSKYCKPPINKYSGVYYVIPSQGVIYDVIDNSDSFRCIVHSEMIMGIGDYFSDLIDGADKRAAIIVYSSDIPRPIKNPMDVIQIKTNS
jgi:biotin carboxylase